MSQASTSPTKPVAARRVLSDLNPNANLRTSSTTTTPLKPSLLSANAVQIPKPKSINLEVLQSSPKKSANTASRPQVSRALDVHVSPDPKRAASSSTISASADHESEKLASSQISFSTPPRAQPRASSDAPSSRNSTPTTSPFKTTTPTAGQKRTIDQVEDSEVQSQEKMSSPKRLDTSEKTGRESVMSGTPESDWPVSSQQKLREDEFHIAEESSQNISADNMNVFPSIATPQFGSQGVTKFSQDSIGESSLINYEAYEEARLEPVAAGPAATTEALVATAPVPGSEPSFMPMTSMNSEIDTIAENNDASTPVHSDEDVTSSELTAAASRAAIINEAAAHTVLTFQLAQFRADTHQQDTPFESLIVPPTMTQARHRMIVSREHARQIKERRIARNKAIKDTLSDISARVDAKRKATGAQTRSGRMSKALKETIKEANLLVEEINREVGIEDLDAREYMQRMAAAAEDKVRMAREEAARDIENMRGSTFTVDPGLSHTTATTGTTTGTTTTDTTTTTTINDADPTTTIVPTNTPQTQSTTPSLTNTSTNPYTKTDSILSKQNPFTVPSEGETLSKTQLLQNSKVCLAVAAKSAEEERVEAEEMGRDKGKGKTKEKEVEEEVVVESVEV